jgi:hypothetical protein
VQPGVVLLATGGSNLPNCVELADLDGDLDLDLVTDATAAGGGHVLLRNDGTGAFAPHAAFTATLGVLPLAVAAGDADGDGDVDLVVRDFFGQMVRLLRNGGGGAFVADPRAFPAQVAGTGTSLLFEDFDGDGDRDVFTATAAGPDNVRLFVNDGTGRFADDTAARWGMPVLGGTWSWDAIAADFDGDGDLDIGQGAPEGLRIAYNHTRQLHVAAAPRLGTSARIDVWAGHGYAPAAGSLLLASFGQRASPLSFPGIAGLIELDASALSLGFQSVPAPGIGSTQLPIPNVLAFSGMRLWFQNLVLPQGSGALGFGTAMSETILP